MDSSSAETYSYDQDLDGSALFECLGSELRRKVLCYLELFSLLNLRLTSRQLNLHVLEHLYGMSYLNIKLHSSVYFLVGNFTKRQITLNISVRQFNNGTLALFLDQYCPFIISISFVPDNYEEIENAEQLRPLYFGRGLKISFAPSIEENLRINCENNFFGRIKFVNATMISFDHEDIIPLLSLKFIGIYSKHQDLYSCLKYISSSPNLEVCILRGEWEASNYSISSVIKELFINCENLSSFEIDFTTKEQKKGLTKRFRSKPPVDSIFLGQNLTDFIFINSGAKLIFDNDTISSTLRKFVVNVKDLHLKSLHCVFLNVINLTIHRKLSNLKLLTDITYTCCNITHLCITMSCKLKSSFILEILGACERLENLQCLYLDLRNVRKEELVFSFVENTYNQIYLYSLYIDLTCNLFLSDRYDEIKISKSVPMFTASKPGCRSIDYGNSYPNNVCETMYLGQLVFIEKMNSLQLINCESWSHFFEIQNLPGVLPEFTVSYILNLKLDRTEDLSDCFFCEQARYRNEMDSIIYAINKLKPKTFEIRIGQCAFGDLIMSMDHCLDLKILKAQRIILNIRSCQGNCNLTQQENSKLANLCDFISFTNS